jgi:hypothetical protein
MSSTLILLPRRCRSVVSAEVFYRMFGPFRLSPRLLLSLQLLKPWHPAFGIKLSHNQFYVMFKNWEPPSRLRSWIKRDILSRRSRPYFESCQKIVAARAADNGTNEQEWFKGAAEALENDMPHFVRTVFHDGAAFDLQMQRAVSARMSLCWCSPRGL